MSLIEKIVWSLCGLFLIILYVLSKAVDGNVTYSEPNYTSGFDIPTN